MLPEIWKPVVGHEGTYEVSDHGRVRSIDHTRSYERIDQYSGRIITVRRRHRGRLLRPGRMPGGHLSVALGRGNSVCVHILVLDAFVGPCPDGQKARHRDDVPDNNRLQNLCWGTRTDNLHDAVRNGRRRVGDDHHQSKLTAADIPVIRSMFGAIPYSAIAREYHVAEATIRQIKTGRSWRHVAC